jgi:hypothetical protein
MLSVLSFLFQHDVFNAGAESLLRVTFYLMAFFKTTSFEMFYQGLFKVTFYSEKMCDITSGLQISNLFKVCLGGGVNPAYFHLFSPTFHVLKIL